MCYNNPRDIQLSRITLVEEVSAEIPKQKHPDTCGYGLNCDLWDLGVTGISVKWVLRGDSAHSQGDLRMIRIDVKPKVLALKFRVCCGVKNDSILDELTIGSPLPSSSPLRLP